MAIFPGTGHTYLVDFGTWRVQLYFTSDTQLTYSQVAADGTVSNPETVMIETKMVRPDIFVVRWKEGNEAVVVHVEDFALMRIYTNIVERDLTLSVFDGSMTQVR